MRVYVRDKGRTLSDFADERNLHLLLEFHDNRWLASLVPGPQYKATHGPACALTKDDAITALCASIGVLKRSDRMLVLTRKIGERIMIGEDVVLTVIECTNGRVRLGFEGPKEIQIDREEIRRKRDEN